MSLTTSAVTFATTFAADAAEYSRSNEYDPRLVRLVIVVGVEFSIFVESNTTVQLGSLKLRSYYPTSLVWTPLLLGQIEPEINWLCVSSKLRNLDRRCVVWTPPEYSEKDGLQIRSKEVNCSLAGNGMIPSMCSLILLVLLVQVLLVVLVLGTWYALQNHF